MTVENKLFAINNGSSNFQSKQRDLFTVLAGVERNISLEHHNEEPMEVEVDRRHMRRNRKATRALRGQESIFKRPAAPPLRSRIPDFRRNPNRWTKYTLADVSASDMSEASNTAAALAFLQNVHEVPAPEIPEPVRQHHRANLRARTTESDDAESTSSNTNKDPRIAFGEPCPPVEETSSERYTFKKSTLVMPEYVVGEKVKKPKKKLVKDRPVVGKQLNLSHLQDLEEDE